MQTICQKKNNSVSNSSPKTVAEKQKQFLEIYEETLQVGLACESVGIERSEYNNWLTEKKYSEFQERIYSINESLIDIAEYQLIKSIKNGHPKNTRFFLRTKGKERGYVEETNINANVNNFHATPDDIERMKEATKPEIDMSVIDIKGGKK